MQTESTGAGRKPRRDDEFVVTLERLDRKGQGVGEIDWPPFGRFTVLVRHGQPGATLRVQVVRRRGARLDARALEVLDPGPHAAQPRCPHFGTCGGCAFQHLSYGQQLVELRGAVQRALAGAGVTCAVDEVIGMADPFHYRNKMEFTFGTRRWVEPGEAADADQGFAAGLHVPFRHDKVLDVRECHIAFEGADRLLVSLRDAARAAGLSAWDVKDHSGLLRHVVLRNGKHTGQILVYLVTSDQEGVQAIPEFARTWCAAHPEVTTFVHGVNTRPASVAIGEVDHVLVGPGSIEERLLDQTFRIRPTSFFQTNTLAAENLLRVVREEVGESPGRRVLDLYCGTGILGLCVTPAGGELLGLEQVSSSVADARENARQRPDVQATFLEGDVLETLPNWAGPPPDVLIVDPPRAGLHPKVLPLIDGLGSQRLVYVSCNVDKGAADVAVLAALGWELVRVRPLDLFPHTPHVECVLTLERRR
ncbi:MAG: 23S rRNA (uracil(1939)-C(5))-methyltransferase RlmD [Planctomycetota bacterium]